jgi:hypothetical protein
MFTLKTLRRGIIVVTLLGLLGLGAELAAVGHWYGPGQLIPFVLILLAVLSGLWFLAGERRTALLSARVVSVLLILGGLYGALEHTGKESELRQAGRQNELGKPAEADEKPVLGLPEPSSNFLNGPAPLSAPLALSGLGLLLFLALYRREHDLNVDSAAIRQA